MTQFQPRRRAAPRKPVVTNMDEHVNVTREEFTKALTAIHDNVRDLEIQFQRIAQIQVDIDDIKRTLAKRTR